MLDYTVLLHARLSTWSLTKTRYYLFGVFSLNDGTASVHCNLYQESRVTLLSLLGKCMALPCAADFSLLNLPKGKSLGRSKPATNS